MKKNLKHQNPAVPGFKAAGLNCGLKAKGALDLTLVVSDRPAVAAGVFTKNKVRSPSVIWCEQTLRKNPEIRAVVVNSGNANACTGAQGMRACKQIANSLAGELQIQPRQLLIASTGVIGVPLPWEKVVSGVPALNKKLSSKGWMDAARGIMTTDLTLKTARHSFKLNGRNIVVGGFAKGSGMIHPNMATMLGFLFTNAAVDAKTLKAALRQAVDPTFNSISVDGEVSTNDCVICLANGAAGNPPIRKKELPAFVDALTQVCRSLAFQVVQDGEGATKFITVRVGGARSVKQARQVANSVATSSLVKTAVFGEDPNWGRIICAIGYSGAAVNQNRIDISLNGLPLVRQGEIAPGVSQPRLESRMKKKDILIDIGLGQGRAEAEIYTCDFSYDYVRINAEYTT